MGDWTLLEVIFDLKTLRTRINELTEATNDPNFWADPNAAHKKMRELTRLKNVVEPLNKLLTRETEVKEFYEMLSLEPDDELESQADEAAIKLIEDIDTYELATLLSGEYDDRAALLEINAGAGGSEACDWASILFRMYMRWAEKRGFKLEIINETPGDVTGYRTVNAKISGENVYGFLKAEAGVHRLVRISPFDSASRRHTSFAKVEVLPEIEETEVNIDPDDLKIDTLRASGAGGQHVNKTESAVRITHIPTGIVVNCQNERSQHKNRAAAMSVLAARLLEVQQKEDADRLRELRGDGGPAEWGRQIRSYVLQPYTMVKEHRTGHETGNASGVLDGDIDEFIEAFLMQPPEKSDQFIE